LKQTEKRYRLPIPTRIESALTKLALYLAGKIKKSYKISVYKAVDIEAVSDGQLMI